MIVPRYFIAPSTIHNAGKGLFVDEFVAKGSIIAAPDRIDKTFSRKEIDAFDHGSPEADASVRWFGDHHTICLEWTDECYINHSFKPNGLWHLGFVFAREDLPAGTEVTMDYRYILSDGGTAGFCDTESGEQIIGFTWDHVLRESTLELARIVSETIS